MAYVGFSRLERSVARRGGVRDPAAVAAAVGRRKYGAEQFQAAAAKGKKMRGTAPARAGALRRRAGAAS